jgi:hypothetical protein
MSWHGNESEFGALQNWCLVPGSLLIPPRLGGFYYFNGSMRVLRIILTQLIFFAGYKVGWVQTAITPLPPPAEAGSPYGAPYGGGGQSTLRAVGPAYVAQGVQGSLGYTSRSVLPGTVVVPPAQPGYAVPAGVSGPQFGTPSLPPPPMTGPTVMPGPGMAPIVATGPPPPQSLGPNPIAVPVTNEEIAWDQIADVVSDYFQIARERRARREGEVITEGVIETAPQAGATWLEPFRKDSVGSFNRWESTFQTIRRRATVRVIPDAAGYLVEVIVEKELEDLPAPESATAGAVVFRGDEALPSRRLEEVSRTRSSPQWLRLGRDPLLEQRMLADIQARLGGAVVR